MVSRHPVEVGEPGVLTDGDLAAIRRLRSCYDDGGTHALDEALHALCERDLSCYIRVMRAILPDQIRHALLDEGADCVVLGQLDALLRRLQNADHGA
jgi:hypothetical protein